MSPNQLLPRPVVHLELRTGNPARACAVYSQLFGWRGERIHVGTESYLALGWGAQLEVGVIESGVPCPDWLPYVEVDDVERATERARFLGASVALGPTEGPLGWRSVIATPAGAEIGLWHPKP